jgi:hypothetical protein
VPSPTDDRSGELDRHWASRQAGSSAGRSDGRGAIGGAVCALVLAVAFFLPVHHLLRSSAASQEEGSVLEYGVLTAHGEVPTRDFQAIYGPASEWVPALAFKLAGPSVFVERTLGLAYRALLLAAVYSLGRRWSRVAGVTGALLCWAVLLPFGPLAWAWIGGLALASAGLACLVGGTRPLDRPRLLVVGGGVLSGMALLFRPDLVLAVGLSAAVVFKGTRRQQAKGWLVGLLGGVAPYLWLVLTAGPAMVVRGLVLDPVLRMRSGRRLPVPPSLGHVDEYFTRVFGALSGGHRWPGLSLSVQLAGYFYFLVGTILLVVWAAVRAQRRGRGPALLAVAAFAVGLAPQLVQRLEVNHMRIVGCFWVALLPIAILELAGRSASRGWTWALTGVAVAAGLTATSTYFAGQLAVDTMPGFGDSGSGVTSTVRASGRSLPAGSPALAQQIKSVVTVIDNRARPGQRLFVGPIDLRFTNYNETFLYYLLPRLVPATYYLEMNPGLANRPGSGLAKDVASADWLILTSRFVNWSEPNTSSHPGSAAANEVVARKFCLVARVFPYEVLRRASDGPRSAGGCADPTVAGG